MSKLARLLERCHPPVDVSERDRIERVLAAARVFLAGSSLLAIYLDPTQPSRYAAVAHGLLMAYLAGSLLALAVLHLRPHVSPAAQALIHSIDVAWAVLLTLFTEGPSSPFFAFFVFVLVAAAFRWGFRQTLTTAGAVIVLLFAEAALVRPGPGVMGRLFEGQFELNRLVIRSAYLTILGLLLGYLADEEKLLRQETSAIARIVGKVQVGTGFKGTLQAAGDELFELLGGSRTLLAIEELTSGRVFLWDVRRQPAASGGQETTLNVSELEPTQRQTFLFPAGSDSWLAVRRRQRASGTSFHTIGLDSEGRRVPTGPLQVPDALLLSHSCRALFGVDVRLGDEWSGRVLLVDPRRPSIRGLRLLQALVRQLGPAVYSVQLVRRLRSRAGAVERVRIARELHDGVTQSLISAEMQIDVLRRQIEPEAPRVARDVGRIQTLLRQEVARLRDIGQHLRSFQVGPRQLLDCLAEAADRFQRETGISARFESDASQVRLTPRACREVVHIVQEGLANVRRHSAAHHVLVRFSEGDGRWRLTIDDDGQGFPFAGRFEQAALDTLHLGPRIIKERVRELGGQLILQSAPGEGAHLEITCR